MSWVGNGTAAAPYAALFNGTSSGSVDFGATVLDNQTRILFTTWINSAAATTSNATILSNDSDGNGNGFTLRQSISSPGKLDLTVGNSGSQICVSTSTFQSGDWNHVSAIMDGTNAFLYVNGRQECSVRASTGLESQNNLFVGSNSSGTPWTGSMAQLKVYGTSDGVSVASSLNVKADFDATADTFRLNPVGNIVTNGLVIYYDAANAARGLAFPGAGCVITSFTDLSLFNLVGTLQNFSSCGTYGWQGTGNSGSPFVLNFDGSASSVDVGVQSALDLTAVTLSAWINVSSYSSQDPRIFHYNNPSAGVSYLLALDSGADEVSQSFWGGVGSNAIKAQANTVPVGTWVNIVMTSNSGGTHLYLDGQLQTGTVPNSPLYGDTQASIGCRKLGGGCGGNTLFQGSLAYLNVYNRALSQSEVSQNCQAQQGRISAVPICQ